MRDISYDGLTTQYGGSSLSLLVADLLEGHTVVDMAYTSEPEPVIWSVRGDGVMLGTTYDGDNNIRGWHIHDTPYGQWEYACSVREPMEDVRYDSVDRTLPLHQRRRYFERYRSRSMLGDIRKSHCVDAGVRYESPFEEGAPLALDPLSMTRAAASPVTFAVSDAVDIVHWMRKEGKRVPGPHHKKRYEIKSTTATLLEFRAVGAGADIDGTDVLDFPVLEFGVYLAENTIKRGMQHLANETTLDVLANGLYYANLTVTGDGDLVLPGGVKASQFSIGWRYDADFGTLPIEGLDPAGESNIGKDIAVKRPVLLFYNSHKGSVGPDVDRIRELAQETDANFNDELQLFSEAHVADMQPARNEGTFFYRHSKPTPVTILATVLIHD